MRPAKRRIICDGTVMDMQQRLIAIGDSITLGHWDPSGGWIARLRHAADEAVLSTEREQYAAVYNLGISSNTSADVLARYQSEVSGRLLRTDDEEAYIALAVGINDSQLANGKQLFSVESYEENMHKLLALALEAKDRVVVVGLTPVNQRLTTPVKWDKTKTKSFCNESIAIFNDAAANVAGSHGVAFADLFSDPVLQGEDVHLNWDGLHLNTKGHDQIAQIVGGTLVELGWKAWTTT